MNPALRTLVLLSKRDPVVPGSPGVPATDADLGAALADLVDAGLGWVVLHPELCRDTSLEIRHKARITDLVGAPPDAVAGAWVWRLGPDSGAEAD